MRGAVSRGRASAITRLAAMPGKKRLAGALAVAAAAVAISACGSSNSDKTIDPADAQSLESALTAVQSAVDEGHCNVAQAEAQNFVDAVNNLPDTVGTDDKDALRDAGENLEQLASDPSQCHAPPTGASGITGPQQTSTSTTTTSTAAPTSTDTTTTSSTTSTTTSQPPADNGGGEGTGGGQPSGTGGGGDTGGGGAGTGGGSDTGGEDTGGGSGETGGGTGSGGTGAGGGGTG
jgi:hypothetical protein